MPYTHLTENERYVISHLSIAGFTHREIARRINRHHTTVSRELELNGPEYDCTIYWYDWTHSSLSMLSMGDVACFTSLRLQAKSTTQNLPFLHQL